jgi:prepilin-type N-terminal cleavage/methylation domain-containing protein
MVVVAISTDKRDMIMNKLGFSLIELMLVVSLTAILVTVTFTNFSFLNRTIIAQEIDKLYAAILFTQNWAIVSNKTQTIVFDKAQKLYSFNGRIEKLAKPLEFGFLPLVKGPPSAPTHDINNPITFKNNTLECTPQGIISSGAIYIVDKDKTCMYALSSSVSQVSFLRKYRYDKKWGLIH